MPEKKEYIEREAAVKELNKWALAYVEYDSIASISAASIVCSVRDDIINKLPAADVKERKRSKRPEIFKIILYILTVMFCLGATALLILPLPDVKYAAAFACISMGLLSVSLVYFLYGGKYPLC